MLGSLEEHLDQWQKVLGGAQTQDTPPSQVTPDHTPGLKASGLSRDTADDSHDANSREEEESILSDSSSNPSPPHLSVICWSPAGGQLTWTS